MDGSGLLMQNAVSLYILNQRRAGKTGSIG